MTTDLEIIWVWDDPEGNVAHIAAHDITPDEVAQALRRVRLRSTSRSTARSLWIGSTDGGRLIAVAFEWVDPITIYPVTAFDAEE